MSERSAVPTTIYCCLESNGTFKLIPVSMRYSCPPMMLAWQYWNSKPMLDLKKLNLHALVFAVKGERYLKITFWVTQTQSQKSSTAITFDIIILIRYRYTITQPR